MKKYKVLACEALARMTYQSAALSPHIIDVTMFPLGLHRNPANLRARLQQEIDACDAPEYDGVLMAYGLCGQATMNLVARNIPLVIPRCHDCITLFLGSRAKYNQQQEACPGTYWYATDYIERGRRSGTRITLGADMESGWDVETAYQEYEKKYGKDNADYLMEMMGAWKSHYSRAAYIEMGVGDGSNVKGIAEEEAQRRGWTFEQMTGDMVLIRRLLFGEWGDDFLTVQPGESIQMTYNDEVIKAKRVE